MTNIFEIREQILSRKKTAVEFVKEAISKAKEIEKFNAFTSLTEERALARAQEIDEKISKGEKVGELAGVPFVAKDNFLVFTKFNSARKIELEVLKDEVNINIWK